MINQMMNDGKMMGTMMKMMHEKGMMSEDCMESCSKMMGEKGMDMQGMKMDNMEQLLPVQLTQLCQLACV